jgi:CBS domain containing-hemolysin-like protein
MIELILAVAIALFVSAGCSLFEAVLYSIPMGQVEILAQQNRSGRILRELRNNIDRPIAAILTLNTISHTAGAAVAGSAVTAVFGSQWLFHFSIIFTLAILIFSEIIPKTAGVVYTRTLAPLLALPLRALVWVMAPAIWFVGHITKLISREQSEDSVTPDEIKIMATLSLKSGGIKHYQKSVIDNVIALENKTVQDVMTPRTVVFSLSEHLTLEEAGRQSQSWEHSRFPVYDKDMEDVKGIVLTKELFIALDRGENDRQLNSLMRPVRFVVEKAKLSNVLLEFIESREKLFVAVDEYGGLSGLVSLEDVLEAILGRQIMDESDRVADKQELARRRRRGTKA